MCVSADCTYRTLLRTHGGGTQRWQQLLTAKQHLCTYLPACCCRSHEYERGRGAGEIPWLGVLSCTVHIPARCCPVCVEWATRERHCSPSVAVGLLTCLVTSPAWLRVSWGAACLVSWWQPQRATALLSCACLWAGRADEAVAPGCTHCSDSVMWCVSQRLLPVRSCVFVGWCTAVRWECVVHQTCTVPTYSRSSVRQRHGMAPVPCAVRGMSGGG